MAVYEVVLKRKNVIHVTDRTDSNSLTTGWRQLRTDVIFFLAEQFLPQDAKCFFCFQVGQRVFRKKNLHNCRVFILFSVKMKPVMKTYLSLLPNVFMCIDQVGSIAVSTSADFDLAFETIETCFTQWHESWHACQDAWVCLPRSWQDLAKILPRLPWSCKIMARLTMRLTKRTKIFHVSYQAFPCVLPSISRFFYPSCQSNQDFFMHFAKHSKIFVVTCKA